MTALAICYVESGFSIAADGRTTSDSGDTLAITSDLTQKIFPTDGINYSLAYVMTGELSSDDYAYDLHRETKNLAERLSLRQYFQSFKDYYHRLAEELKGSLTAHKVAGRLSPYPNPKIKIDRGDRENIVAELSLVGYFFNFPVWARLTFVHKKPNHIGAEVYTPYPLCVGFNGATGSTVVPHAVCDGDPRLEKYRQALTHKWTRSSTLEDATHYVTAYVGACCDPRASEIDHDHSQFIGGHIHVAELTASGFRWRIPPKRLTNVRH